MNEIAKVKKEVKLSKWAEMVRKRGVIVCGQVMPMH